MLTTNYSFNLKENSSELYILDGPTQVSLFSYASGGYVLAARPTDNTISEVDFINGMDLVRTWVAQLKNSISVAPAKYSDQLEYQMKKRGPNGVRLTLDLGSVKAMDVRWDKSNETVTTKGRDDDVNFNITEFDAYIDLLESLEFLIRDKRSEGL